jgi:glycerate dehydrogenase
MDSLISLGNVILYKETLPKETISRLADCEIAITNKVVIGRKEMAANPQLKLICVAATGTNNIDLVAAKELGIEIRNVKGYSTESVTQVTFSVLLALLTQTAYFDRYVKSGEYSHSPHFSHFGHEFWQLSGKTFGIIGLGEIGLQVAKVASAFGCDIIYYSTSGKNHNPSYKSVGLDELLSKSDIVSIHAPLNPQTENLITFEKLGLMKRSAYIINVGRGGIINETDLANAIDANLIAGAAIDVFTKEPIVSDNPLLKVRKSGKLLLTPHIAWASVEARKKLLEGICNNIKSFLQSKKE